MDATWPDDIWKNTFDIKADGSAEVEYDVVMAVPKHEPRPIDYLNFSILEANFNAYDTLTGEELKVEEQINNQRKTVFITPYHEVSLGENYKYKLKFNMPRGLISQIADGFYLLQWGWGNWPLEYSLKFILPQKSCVYFSSNNLVQTKIENDRPILTFKDRSEHNNSIQIQAHFYRGDQASIQLLRFEDNPDHKVHCQMTYNISDDFSAEASLKIRNLDQSGL